MKASDDALSRVICEFLEPWDGWKIRGKNGRWQTEGGLWATDFGWNNHPPREAFQPRDMVNDSAMTLMLMETRFFYSIRKHARGWVFQNEEGVDTKYINDLSIKSLGRAVAEAFAKAHNLKVE